MMAPKILYVTSSETSTESGDGHIGYRSLQVCLNDLAADQVNGVAHAGEVWVYRLESVQRAGMTLQKRKVKP